MSAILPSYEYLPDRHTGDIFISYRQKDNRSDQWVTQFVQALKEELDATFKEDISVYFDENPHDGLHDTHDVDDSLKEKVKCLIFIPIVSRTYCDPKSFAWAKEFLPFLDFAKNDEHGLKVKLANGNVTSRVLPIRIHDLDKEDVVLFEKETGGVIRSIDFVYHEAGVNRPLHSEDDKKNYRNQVNKLGGSIKDILQVIKKGKVTENNKSIELEKTEISAIALEKKRNVKAIVGIGFITILCALLFFGYISLMNSNSEQNEDKILNNSIAVLPFTNLSEDGVNNYITNGFRAEIHRKLSSIQGFQKVLSNIASDKYQDSGTSLTQVASELDVNYMLQANVLYKGKRGRIALTLVNADDKTVWSWDRSFMEDDVIALIPEIAGEVAGELETYLSPAEKEQLNQLPTDNIQAYSQYLLATERGKLYFSKSDTADLIMSKKYSEQAIYLDSSFALPYTLIANYWLSQYYNGKGDDCLDSAVFYNQKALLLNNRLPQAYLSLSQAFRFKGEYQKSKKALFNGVAINQNNAIAKSYLGHYHSGNLQYDSALIYYKTAYQLEPTEEILNMMAWAYIQLRMYEKSFDIWQQLINKSPENLNYYSGLSVAYLYDRNMNQAIEFNKKGLSINPDNTHLIHNLALKYSWEGEHEKAIKLFEELIDKVSQEDYDENPYTYVFRNRYAFSLWSIGQKVKARNLFEQQIENDLQELGNGSLSAGRYYDIAASHAFLGNTEEAIKYAELAANTTGSWFGYEFVMMDPLLDPIRKDPRFIALMQKQKAKMDKMYENVRMWEETNNLKSALDK